MGDDDDADVWTRRTRTGSSHTREEDDVDAANNSRCENADFDVGGFGGGGGDSDSSLSDNEGCGPSDDFVSYLLSLHRIRKQSAAELRNTMWFAESMTLITRPVSSLCAKLWPWGPACVPTPRPARCHLE